jgi:nucleoside-diphosphate-sugar epimerase
VSQTTTCLVTGGAGFLGINLVRYLLARGYAVTSLDLADFDYPERDRVRIVRGDIRDRAAVERAVDGAQLVVHCAAALPRHPPAEIYSTDIDGTRTVIDAAHRKQAARFIQISSTAVYGIPDHHPLCETDPLHGVGPYGEAKIEAEAVCLEYRRRGMCVPILRPVTFVGPERLGVFALLYEWASEGRGFPMIGSGKNHLQFLDVEDLCDAINLAATVDPAVASDTFNLGAERFMTVREDYQAVLDHAGFGKRMRAFPATPMIWTLRVLEQLRLSPLYRWIYETAGIDFFVSIEKAKRVLGFAPKYSNQDALVRNYQWYLDNREHIAGQSGVTHRVPWKQGALAMAKWLF